MGFNADDHEIKLIPAGTRVTGMLVKAKKTESNNNPGNFYFAAQFKITHGEYKGKVIFENINLENANATCEEMGQAFLANLMIGAGVKTLESMWDVTPLLNEPVDFTIKVEESDDYGDKNRIKEFFAPTGVAGDDDDAPDFGEKKGKKKKKKKGASLPEAPADEPKGKKKKKKKGQSLPEPPADKPKGKKGKKGKKKKKEDVPF